MNRFLCKKLWFWKVIATFAAIHPITQVVSQSCPMTLWVFSDVNDCYQSKAPESIGTIYADGQCRTLDVDGVTNQTQPLFPGTYAAECTANGNLNFLHSGCLDDTCLVSSLQDDASCDADFSAVASLFATNPTADRPVQDPGSRFDNTFSCYFMTGGNNGELYVAFAVFGDCSAGCQVDGVAAPTAPTNAPVARPPPTSAPVRKPSNAPVRAPTNAPLAVPAPTTAKAPIAVNSTNATAAPSSVPTVPPVVSPVVVPAPTIQNPPTSKQDTPSLFRNETIQGTASISVNGTLTLPPPASPEIRETIVDLPENGALQLNPSDGSITYKPNPTFVGFDSFQIQQCIDNGSSSNEDECETITVAIEVTAASSDSSTPPPDDSEPSSSSSKGIYGLAALAIIPIAFVFYIYRKKQNKKQDQPASYGTRTKAADSSHINAGENVPPSNDVSWDQTVPPHIYQPSNSNYLPTNKDQVRDVPAAATSEHRTDDISVITQSTTNHDGNAAAVTREDEPMSPKNYRFNGSGRLHPLAAHLMEVRSTSTGTDPSHHASSHSSAVVAAAPIVAEPQAQPIHDVYTSGTTKRQVPEPAVQLDEPIIVNAILISEEDDLAEYQNKKIPANRQEI